MNLYIIDTRLLDGFNCIKGEKITRTHSAYD